MTRLGWALLARPMELVLVVLRGLMEMALAVLLWLTALVLLPWACIYVLAGALRSRFVKREKVDEPHDPQ